jgi:hypothetical protein
LRGLFFFLVCLVLLYFQKRIDYNLFLRRRRRRSRRSRSGLAG